MRISRHLLMTCAVATFLTPAFVHAFDNEAQIRARQALEEKMKQADTQTPPATSAPPAVVTNPAPAVKAMPSSSNEEQMRAQQALEEKMKQIETQTPPTMPAPPATVSKPAPSKRAKAPAPKPEPPVVTVTPNKSTVENPPAQAAPAFAPEISQPATPAAAAPATSVPSMRPSTDAATSDKLSDALHQKMHETEAEPVAPVAPPVVKAQPPVQHETPMATRPAPAVAPPAAASAPTYAPIPEPSNTVRPTLPETPTPTPAPAPTVANKQPAAPVVNLPPLSGPPSSLSAAKQQKLDALLQQYRADQISPEQYHEQRAKILSEP